MRMKRIKNDSENSGGCATGWSGLTPCGKPHRHGGGSGLVENHELLDGGGTVMQIYSTVDEAPGVHPSTELLDVRFLDI